MKYIMTETQYGRLLSEDENEMKSYFRRRLPEIEQLIYKQMEENSPNDFKGENEYTNNIVNWVVQDLEDFNYDTMDEYQLRNLIKGYFGEIVIDYYLDNEDDDDDDDDEFFDDDEDEF
jgi:phosphopantothenoylcysteine synthetase/decarboxylase